VKTNLANDPQKPGTRGSELLYISLGFLTPFQVLERLGPVPVYAQLIWVETNGFSGSWEGPFLDRITGAGRMSGYQVLRRHKLVGWLEAATAPEPLSGAKFLSGGKYHCQSHKKRYRHIAR